MKLNKFIVAIFVISTFFISGNANAETPCDAAGGGCYGFTGGMDCTTKGTKVTSNLDCGFYVNSGGVNTKLVCCMPLTSPVVTSETVLPVGNIVAVPAPAPVVTPASAPPVIVGTPVITSNSYDKVVKQAVLIPKIATLPIGTQVNSSTGQAMLPDGSVIVIPGSVLGTISSSLAANATTTILDSSPAAGGIIKCGRGNDMCTLCDLIKGMNTIIQYLMKISVGVALLAMAIGGVMYVISAGDTGMADMAKKTIMNAAVGFVIIFAAFLIIDTTIKYVGVADKMGINVTSWGQFECRAGSH